MSPREAALKRWLLPLAALCAMAGLLLGRAAAGWAWAAAGAGLALAALLPARRLPGMRCAAILSLTVCAFALYGYAAWHPALPEERTWHVEATVADEVREGARGQRRTLLRDVTLDGSPLRGGAYWSFYADELPGELAPGARIAGDFSLYWPSGQDNPGGFDFREYLLQRDCRVGLYGSTGLTVTGRSRSVWGLAAGLRHRLTQGLTACMGEEAGGYAAAMLLGARSLVPSEDQDAFARLGIAHILSVSGFHVALLFGALAWVLSRLRTPRAVRFPALALGLGFYCVLTGMGAPVVRASVLILLREWAHLRHRQPEGLHLLSAAALLTLLLSPAQVTGAGFHLTYGALLGLILVMPTMTRGGRAPASLRGKLWQGFTATLAVQVGILLPMLYWYQELPLLSLLINPFVLTAAAGLMGLYWVTLLLMAAPGIGPLLGRLSGLVTGPLTAGARALADTAGVTLWTGQANLVTALGWLLLLAALGWLWRLPRRRRIALGCAGLAVTALSLIPLPHRGTDWTMLSVGSADAAVLRDGDTVWAVDCGEDATLAVYLRQRRLSVDTLVLTHLHRDHALGAEALARDRIPVRRVLLPEGAEAAAVDPECLDALRLLQARGTEIVHAARGDVFTLPGGTVTALWPERGRVRPGMDANASSLALLFELRGVRLLACGDLTGDYEMYSAAPADILKMPHHGSSASCGEAYLAAVSPSLILLSGGDDARLGLTRTRAGEIPVLATQDVGAVTLRLAEGRAAAEGFHPGTR